LPKVQWNLWPAERARQDAEPRLSSEAGKRSDERRALDFQAKHDSEAQKAGLDGNIVRATKLEAIAAKK